MNNTRKNTSLLDDMRKILRREAYAYSTENSYCDWVRCFIKFHGFLDRESMLVSAVAKVEQFLTFLAVERNVAPSTQNQALNALVFCYARVLNFPIEGGKAARARKEPRIPVVLTKKDGIATLNRHKD